jgi:hypothetical protein
LTTTARRISRSPRPSWSGEDCGAHSRSTAAWSRPTAGSRGWPSPAGGTSWPITGAPTGACPVSRRARRATRSRADGTRCRSACRPASGWSRSSIPTPTTTPRPARSPGRPT